MEQKYQEDLVDFIKSTSPPIILNGKLNELNYLSYAMKLKGGNATKRFHVNYKKMLEADTCIMYCGEESPIISNGYVQFIGKIQLVEVNYFI